MILHWSRGQHSSIWNRGLLSLESTVSIAYVAGDLSSQEGDGRGSSERRGDHGRVRTMSNKEVLRFWKLAPCDVEARVRRLICAQTLVQDPSHHTQLITAMFGKLPSEPNPTLGPGGEISPEANQWAVRWKADLEELEPYDERGVIQRVGRDVRAPILDRELAEEFVAMDVTILRLRSLAVEVPPWDFREEAGHPVELSEEGVPQWRCCFLVMNVLRHHRQMEVVSRSVITNQCPVCLAVYGDRKKRPIVISCHRFVVGLVVIDHAQPNLEIGQNSNSTSLNICATFSKMTDFEMPSWGKRKPEEAPQGQGRRAVRLAVAEGRNDRDVTRRLGDVLATLSLVNAAEMRELTATVFKTYLVPGSESVAEAMAEAGRLYHESSGAIKSKPADAQEQLGPPYVMCGWRSCAVWRRRGGCHQNA